MASKNEALLTLPMHVPRRASAFLSALPIQSQEFITKRKKKAGGLMIAGWVERLVLRNLSAGGSARKSGNNASPQEICSHDCYHEST